MAIRAGEVPDSGRRWDRMLTAAFGALMAGGAVLIAAPHGFALAWLDAAVARAFFGASDVGSGVAELQGWLYAVEGSTLVAFGALGLAVVRTAFRRRERWARNALVFAVAAWFPLDTVASLAYGVWENAVLNTVIAAFLLLPVAAMWGRFPGTTGEHPRALAASPSDTRVDWYPPEPRGAQPRRRMKEENRAR